MTHDSHKYKSQFQVIFKEYYNPLCNFANSILRDSALAEDAIQDVFTSFWQKSKVDTIDNPKAFLFQCAKNRAFEVLRSKKKMSDYALKLEREYTDVLAIEELSERYMLKEKLFRKIAELPPQCQKILKLSKLNGFTYKEIATELDISVKTVENQIGRGLRLLRLKMATAL